MCITHVTWGYLGKAYPEGENQTGAQADMQQVFKTVSTQKVTSTLKISLWLRPQEISCVSGNQASGMDFLIPPSSW